MPWERGFCIRAAFAYCSTPLESPRRALHGAIGGRGPYAFIFVSKGEGEGEGEGDEEGLVHVQDGGGGTAGGDAGDGGIDDD